MVGNGVVFTTDIVTLLCVGVADEHEGSSM